MLERSGNTLRVTAAMTMDTSGPLLEAGMALLNGGAIEVDLAAVDDIDSAALGLMFEWLRQAQTTNTSLVFANLPQPLISLATLYGVLDLIPQHAH